MTARSGDDVPRLMMPPGVEAVVLSCTDMRSVGTIDRLEAELGKPVVSSNQAMLFAALRDADIDGAGVACGRLFGRGKFS